MNKPPLTVVYFGTPEFAVPPLRWLVENGFDIKAVVTQPDRPSGRGKKLQAPAVKTYALSQGLTVLQPEKINKEMRTKIAELQAGTFVVCAYGKILSQKMIDTPKHIINIHASILPKYRGAAPIHAAIKNGDQVTGISIMKIVKELDAGDVLLTKKLPIAMDDSLATVTQKLSLLGADALCEAFQQIKSGTLRWEPQNHKEATYAHKIHPDEAKICWNMPALEVHNFIRSYGPQPGAFTVINDEKIKIITTSVSTDAALCESGSIEPTKKQMRIACSDYWLEVTRIQPVGKKIMDTGSFLNGYRRELIKCR